MFYDFDTTATSPVLPEVLADYARHLAEPATNPSSTHGGGLRAAGLLEGARQTIGRVLDCLPEEVIFTSGGTESINLALKGAAWSLGRRPRRILTTAGEHDAVLNTVDFLREKEDFQAYILPLTREGSLDPKALHESLEKEAWGLVSLIGISNETGANHDLEGLVSLIRSLSPHALIHADLVQTGGKLPFSFRRSGLDLASFSGHKFGAPRGTGFLVKKKGLKLTPLIHGGGQEGGLRSGTVDLAGALALAKALDIHEKTMEENLEKVKAVRSHFLDQLRTRPDHFQILSPQEGSPYVLALALPGLRGETLMHALSAEGIYISTGSACSSKKAGDNRVLTAMGLARDTILSSVRISFHPGHSLQDVEVLAQKMGEIYQRYALAGRER